MQGATVVERRRIEITTEADTDVHDLTPHATEFVTESDVEEGQLLLFVAGSTAGITTVEFESGCVADLGTLFEKIASSGADYEHNRRWGDGNGYSHMRAALLGPSLTVPIAEGRLLLGTWQQIVLCDFDNRPRRRDVVMQVAGIGG